LTISRATGTLTFPANLMLVGAMNPCPCGYHGDPVKECTCSTTMITRYGKRIPSLSSGQAPARSWTAVRSLSLCEVDILVEVPRVDYD